MKSYEMMIVLRADYPIDDEKKIRDYLTKLTGGASVTNISVLGKKRLAYPIKKIGVSGMQTEGIYVLATIEGEGIKIGAIEKEVSLGTEVLRYLLTAQKEGKK